jgi:hypothetical protein
MGKAKELFLRSKSDVSAALQTVKSRDFETLLTFARSEFSERNPTAEQSRGVSMFIEVLRNLPEDEPDETTWAEITSGASLDHEMRVPIRQIPTEKNEPQKPV